MRVSDRIRNIVGDGSDGWELFATARRMKADGHDIVELTVGQHDVPTDARILDAMHASAMSGHTGYAALPGTNELRDRVAARIEERTGVRTTRDNVLITPGAQSALFSAHNVALEHGDTALFIDPYYATYPGTIRAVGGVPRDVPATSRSGFQPDLARLESAASGARSLLINSPNNPTGAVYSSQTMQAIARTVREHDLWLISDEVYESQNFDGSHQSARALPGMADRTLLVSSMSKTFAMTGSRIGWLVGPEDAIAKAIDLTTHTTYGVAGFVQDAACFALGLGAAFEAELAEPFRRRRALAEVILRGQRQFCAVPSQATMYLMLDIRPTGLSGRDFAHRLLHERGIAVMPGESFGAQAAGHIRVALTVDDAQFEAAFRLLLEFAQDIAHD